MHSISKILTALLCILLAASPAGSGSMLLLGVGKAGTTLPGPPVFTFQAIALTSVSTNTATITASIGTAGATRRVYAIILDVSAETPVSATFNGSAGDVFQVIGTTATDGGLHVTIASAVVTTGTTATIVFTYTGTLFSTPVVSTYTVDSTTLSSATPVIFSQSVVTAATANPATANTYGIATSTAGSAILAGFVGFGITNNSQSFTSSDASVSTDGVFSSFMTGHANSAPASASSRVNTGWTTSGDSLLALAVFR